MKLRSAISGLLKTIMVVVTLVISLEIITCGGMPY